MKTAQPARVRKTDSTLVLKLSLLAGATALASDATAQIIAAQNTPISPPAGSPGEITNTTWDVDGLGSTGPGLRNNGNSSASFTGSNVVGGSSGISNLENGDIVSAAGASFIDCTVTSSGDVAALLSGWTKNVTGKFGFRFTKSAVTNYGWGELRISGTPVGQGLTITKAYYESVAGAPITVGVIPEPGSLALLALGAAGVAAWRARRTRA